MHAKTKHGARLLLGADFVSSSLNLLRDLGFPRLASNLREAGEARLAMTLAVYFVSPPAPVISPIQSMNAREPPVACQLNTAGVS